MIAYWVKTFHFITLILLIDKLVGSDAFLSLIRSPSASGHRHLVHK